MPYARIEDRRAAEKRSREKYPERVRARQKKWFAELSEDKRALRRERSKEASRHAYAVRPEKIKLAVKKAAANHPETVAACSARKRARKIQACPIWADHAKIDAIYAEAQERGLTVDHIVPLQGANVSGLHVHWNLQLLTRSENSSKGNRL